MRRAERQERILQALRAGATRTAAATFAGAGRRTLYSWMDDAAFAAAVERAEASFLVAAAGNIYRAGHEAEVTTTTKPDGTITERRRGDWRALAWLLERRHPDDYGEPKQRHEISGPDGRPIEITHRAAIKALMPGTSDDEADMVARAFVALIEETLEEERGVSTDDPPALEGGDR